MFYFSRFTHWELEGGGRGGPLPEELARVEFSGQALHPEILQANVSYLSHDAFAEEIVGRSVRPRDLARLTDFLAGGAWAYFGTTLEGELDPIPILKPLQPRQDLQKGKPIKYETPWGRPATPWLPWIPEVARERISRRFGLSLTGNPWQTILENPEVPLFITEGPKKALALLGMGAPAIALRGVTQWHPKRDNWPYEVLSRFAQKRQIFIVFDQDDRLTTRRNVGQQACKLAQALLRCGAQKVRFLEWDGKKGKGIDDFLGQLPSEDRWTTFTYLMESALSLERFKSKWVRTDNEYFLQRLQDLDNEYYITKKGGGISPEEIINNLNNRVVAISAPIGAGKTTALVDIVNHWRTNRPKDRFILVLTPRNSLGQQAAQKLSLPHIHALDSEDSPLPWSSIWKRGGLVMCPDSLHQLPPFVFTSTNLLLILDEANQVLRHIIQGGTLKERWTSHNLLFARLLKQASGVVAMESDLPGYALTFLTNVSDKPVFALRYSTPPPNQATCYIYEANLNRVHCFHEKLVRRCLQGGKLLVVSTSQKFCAVLHQYLIEKDPRLKIHRIDSETNDLGQYNRFFTNPDEWLLQEQPDILILSPSAESGVSIQAGVPPEEAYFSEVWGYFPNLTSDVALQMLGRYRPSVPRHIFAPAFTPHGTFENASPSQIRSLLRYLAEGLAKSFAQSLAEAGEYQQHWEEYYAWDQARTYHLKNVHREAIIQELVKNGWEIQRVPLKPELGLFKFRSEWDQVKIEVDRQAAHRQATAVIDPTIHTTQWARQILGHKNASLLERTIAIKVLRREQLPSLHKELDNLEFVYTAFYENGGRLHRQARLRALAEIGKDSLWMEWPQIQAILESPIRPAHHIPREALKATLIAESGVLELIGQKYHNFHPVALKVKKFCIRYATAFKVCLNHTFTEDQSPSYICNCLLRLLGIEVVVSKQLRLRTPEGGNHQRPRLYCALEPDPSHRQGAVYNQLVKAYSPYFASLISHNRSIALNHPQTNSDYSRSFTNRPPPLDLDY